MRRFVEFRVWLVAGLLASMVVGGLVNPVEASVDVDRAASERPSLDTSAGNVVSNSAGEVELIASTPSSANGIDLVDLFGNNFGDEYIGTLANGQMIWSTQMFGVVSAAPGGSLAEVSVAYPEAPLYMSAVVMGANGTTYAYDADMCQLVKLVPGATQLLELSVSHTSPVCISSSPNDGNLSTQELPYIGAMAIDGSGHLYLAEATMGGSGKIRKLDPATGSLTTVAGTGVPGNSGDGGSPSLARINVAVDPWGMSGRSMGIDGSGRIVFVQSAFDGGGVRRIDTVANTISTVLADPVGDYEWTVVGSDGTIYATGLGIGLDGEELQHRIVKVSSAGVVSYLGNGQLGFDGDGGAAVSAKMAWPRLIEVLPDNSLVIEHVRGDEFGVLNGERTVLRRVTSAGIISTIAGTGDISFSYPGSTSLSGIAGSNTLVVAPGVREVGDQPETFIYAGLQTPVSARTDSGHVEMFTSYGTGSGYTVARRVVMAGGSVTDTSGIAVPIDPEAIDYDTAGNAYYVPRGQCRIVKRTSQAVETTFFGTQACAVDSLIQNTGSLMVHRDGSVYWSAVYGQTIERFAPNGTRETIANAPDDCTQLDDPPVAPGGAFVTCFRVGSMTVDDGGNVFLHDGTTGRLVKLDGAGQFTLVPGDSDPDDGQEGFFFWSAGKLVFDVDRTTLYVGMAARVFRITNVGATSTPSVPRNFRVMAGDAQVTAYWDPPASNGGSPVTGYRVIGGTNCETITETFCTITGLTNVGGYGFSVVAFNEFGSGVESDVLEGYPAATPSATVLNSLPATLPVPDATPSVGEPFVLNVSGFQPFEVVVISLQSNPQVLNTALADTQGSISVTVIVPDGTPTGSHTISALGTSSGVGYRAPVEVTPSITPFAIIPLDSPKRIVDTRASGGRFGSSSSSGVSVRRVQVAGALTYQGAVTGLPSSGIGAVAMNVTVVDGRDQAGYGFVTVFPCASTSTPVPDASNLNFSGGQTVPNAVLAPLSSDGYVCFSVYGDAHLLVDISAWTPVPV